MIDLDHNPEVDEPVVLVMDQNVLPLRERLPAPVPCLLKGGVRGVGVLQSASDERGRRRPASDERGRRVRRIAAGQPRLELGLRHHIMLLLMRHNQH